MSNTRAFKIEDFKEVHVSQAHAVVGHAAPGLQTVAEGISMTNEAEVRCDDEQFHISSGFDLDDLFEFDLTDDLFSEDI